jgi:hypothetical protein
MGGSTTDFLSGMFPRFLLVPYFGPESQIEDPPPCDKMKRAALVKRLEELAMVGEREYVYSNDALAAKHKWLMQFNKRAENAELLLSAFYRKMRDEHFHKVAMICAFERNSTVISIEDVAETAALLWSVEKEWGTLLESLTEKEWDRDANRVELYIKKVGSVDRSDILQNVRGVKAQKLTAILAGLEQDRKIAVKSEDTGGRKKVSIMWVFSGSKLI